MRRQVLSEQEGLNRAHGPSSGSPPLLPGYGPARPWNLIYQTMIAMEGYWREEVVEPSVLLPTKGSGLMN